MKGLRSELNQHLKDVCGNTAADEETKTSSDIWRWLAAFFKPATGKPQKHPKDREERNLYTKPPLHKTTLCGLLHLQDKGRSFSDRDVHVLDRRSVSRGVKKASDNTDPPPTMSSFHPFTREWTPVLRWPSQQQGALTKQVETMSWSMYTWVSQSFRRSLLNETVQVNSSKRN